MLTSDTFRAVVEGAAEGVVIIDRRGQILFANAAFLRIADRTPSALIGESLDRLLTGRSAEQTRGELALFLETGERGRWRDSEFALATRDGRRVPVEVTVSELAVAGEPLFAAFVRDVARRRRAENELREARRRLQLLNEIVRTATAEREYRPMLQRICDALAGALGWDLVGCLGPRHDGRWVWQATSDAGAGVPETEPDNRLIRRVLETRGVAIVPFIGAEPEYEALLPGARSALVLPVRHRDQLVVLLVVESLQEEMFARHLGFLETVADQLGGTIAAARDHEEGRQRSRALETLSEVSRLALEVTDLHEVLGRIASYVQRQFAMPFVQIVLSDDDSDRLELRAIAASHPLNVRIGDRFEIGEGVIGRAFRSGEPQLVLDVTDDPHYVPVSPLVRAELAMPIRLGSRVLGVLNLESASPRDFGAEACRILAMLADQVAGAIRLALANQRLERTAEALEEANRELQAASDRLRELSLTDPLTGVANRRRFEQALEEEWRRALRTGGVVSLLLFDLDSLKEINDNLGHPAGDRYVKGVADRIVAMARRASDVVARWGGDEFAMLLPGTTADSAIALAETIRTAVQQLPSGAGDAELGRPAVSIGVASLTPTTDLPADALLQAADEALYEAKRAGGNRVVRVAPAPV